MKIFGNWEFTFVHMDSGAIFQIHNGSNLIVGEY